MVSYFPRYIEENIEKYTVEKNMKHSCNLNSKNKYKVKSNDTDLSTVIGQFLQVFEHT